jgi:hypothetical protein
VYVHTCVVQVTYSGCRRLRVLTLSNWMCNMCIWTTGHRLSLNLCSDTVDTVH